MGFEFAGYSFSEEDGLGRVTITSSAALPDGTVIHVNGGKSKEEGNHRYLYQCNTGICDMISS